MSKERKSVSPSRKSLNVPNVMEAHSSFDSVLTADDCISANGHSPPSNSQISNTPELNIDPVSNTMDELTVGSTNSPIIIGAARSASAERGMNEEPGGNFHRTGSERFKEGAKALLRRMESLKSRRRKRSSNNSNRDAVFIDDSVNIAHVQENAINQKQNKLKPPELVLGADDSNDFDFNSDLTIKNQGYQHRTSTGRRFFGTSSQKFDDALSDSECSSATSPSIFPTYLMNDNTSSNVNLLEQYWKSSKLSPPSPNVRTPQKVHNSLTEIRKERVSVYDNVPVVFFNQHFPVCEDKEHYPTSNLKRRGSLVKGKLWLWSFETNWL